MTFRRSSFQCRGLSKPLALLITCAVALAALTYPLLFPGASNKTKARAPGDFCFGKQGDNIGEFQQPRGIATFPDGTFVVVDRAARVQHFSHDGRALSLWSMKDHALGNPKGLCALPDGNMLVCDTHYGRVLKMTPDGEILKVWGEPGKGPAQFVHPMSAAVDAARSVVYVVEYGAYNDRVQKFDLDGKWLQAFGTCGVNDGEFQRPSGIAIDGDGFVYVADACNHRIQKFDGAGKFVKGFGKEGSSAGELRYPYDVAYAADGLLYVVEFANHRVSVFDRDGVFKRCFGEPGYGPNQFANPWSLTADSSGRLLVSDTGNHRVRVLQIVQVPPVELLK